MNVFAQSKGDMYVLTTVNASFGKTSSYQIYNNQSSLYAEQPMDTQLGLGIGFGYFLANNFRLELVVSGYSVKSPREKASTVWLNDVNKGVQINPNISYFVKLADRFYYTPEIGACFDLGKYVYEETVTRSTTYPYRGYTLYANLLAFQFKVSQRFSLGVNVGDVRITILMSHFLKANHLASGGIVVQSMHLSTSNYSQNNSSATASAKSICSSVR